MTAIELQQQLPNRGRWVRDFHDGLGLELFSEHRLEEMPFCSRCGKPCSPYSFARREFCKECLIEILPAGSDYWKVWDEIVAADKVKGKT